jgi:hypothetical protein
MNRIAVAAIVAMIPVGCATVAPPEPLAPEAAGVAIHVETYAPLPLWAQGSGQVFFVRLDEEREQLDGMVRHQVLTSNYNRDGYAYMLNVPAGRYAAVACSREDERPTEPVPVASGSHGNWTGTVSVSIAPNSVSYATYFPEDIVAMTEVAVGPGELKFMGHYTLDQSLGLKKGDELQRHYFGLMAPQAQGRSFLGTAFSGDYHYTGEARESDTGDASRQQFEAVAQEHFEESAWLTGMP